MGRRFLFGLVLMVLLGSVFGCGAEPPVTKPQSEMAPKGRIPMMKGEKPGQ
jgi:hypothetical protein